MGPWARGERLFGARVAVLLTILALIAPSAARIVGSDGAGWFPTHGHIFLTAEAATHPHHHPWDAEAAPTSGEQPPAADAPPDVLFTFGDLDVASALAMIALPAFALLVAVTWRSIGMHSVVTMYAGTRFQPPVPPPQR